MMVDVWSNVILTSYNKTMLRMENHSSGYPVVEQETVGLFVVI